MSKQMTMTAQIGSVSLSKLKPEPEAPKEKDKK